MFRQDHLINGRRLSVIAKETRSYLNNKYKSKEVRFKTTDNLTLSGILIERDKAKGTVILCHGYKRSKEFMTRFISFFNEYNIFMFDFRGNEQSDGDIVTIGLSESCDVISAAKYVKSKLNGTVFILGVSMGASASLRAASIKTDLCDGLILDSPFKDLSIVIESAFTHHSGLPNFPFSFFIKKIAKWIYNCDVAKVNLMDGITKIKIPTFFIHSSDDTMVPAWHTLDLYSEAYKAGNKTSLWITPPVDHGSSSSKYPNEYKKRVQAFLGAI